MPSATLIRLLVVVSLLGYALTAWKLFQSGLHRRYRVFFSYIIFCIPYYVLVLRLDGNSNTYFRFWIVTAPFFWFFHVFIILELYRLVLERHRGLYTLGRWVMYVAMVVAIAISLATVLPRIAQAPSRQAPILTYVIGAERGVDLCLAVFILLILALLTRYPVPLSRNVLVHAVVFSLFFLSTTLGLILRDVFGLQVNNETNLLLTGASSGCTLAWFFLLSAAGEKVTVPLPWLGPEHESRLLTQLDALNATLLKVYRN